MSSFVSVALCTYNGAPFIQDQLASIASQSIQPYELVVCDDQSSDTTAELVEAFARHASFRVLFERNSENLGSTRNFEKAIGLCSGTHIAFADQDDLWYPHKLETLLGAFEHDPGLGGVFSDGDIADDQMCLSTGTLWSSVGFTPSFRRKFRTDPASILLITSVVTGATLMIDARQRESFGQIPASWVHDGWITWMLALKSRIGFVEESLIRYRTHPNQQIGVPPASIRRRLELLRRTAASDLAKEAQQFEVLYDRLAADPSNKFAALLPRLREKIEHDYMCASLPASRFVRAGVVASHWRGYSKYARGMKSMARDMLR